MISHEILPLSLYFEPLSSRELTKDCHKSTKFNAVKPEIRWHIRFVVYDVELTIDSEELWVLPQGESFLSRNPL